MTPVLLRVNGITLTGRLADSAPARALIARMPLELPFRDFNGVEKLSELAQALPMDGVPRGADPDINDIGYYAPTRNLVLYYGRVGYWDGIVQLGRFDGDPSVVRDLADGSVVTLELDPQGS